eukprot:jgi/Hompol1/676/HPOL_002512-RA
MSKAVFQEKAETETADGSAHAVSKNASGSGDKKHVKIRQKLESEAQAPTKRKVVVLKHMFTLKELEEDPTLLLDLKEEVREECEKFGEVTNVVLYDLEEDGVMTVKFKDHTAAATCAEKMNGRFFAGQKVEAEATDGRTKFKQSKGQTEEDEKRRMDAFAQHLENDH